MLLGLVFTHLSKDGKVSKTPESLRIVTMDRPCVQYPLCKIDVTALLSDIDGLPGRAPVVGYR